MNAELPCERLRVTVITETYPPEINGVANTMGHLVRGLEQHGHQVHRQAAFERPSSPASPFPATADSVLACPSRAGSGGYGSTPGRTSATSLPKDR